VFNGKIIAGPAGSIRRAAINPGNDSSVDNLEIYTWGMESSCVGALYAQNVSITNVKCTTRNHGVFSRMQISSAIVFGSNKAGTITVQNNDVDSGTAWGCYYLSGGMNADVSGNKCRTESSVTNHHGIVAFSANSSSIHDNTIVAEYGQGILVSGSPYKMKVYANHISMHGQRPNAEYGLFSLDGIRINDYGTPGVDPNDGQEGIEVFGNDIKITGGLDPHFTNYANSKVDGRVLNGIMMKTSGPGNVVHGNKIDVQIDDPNHLGTCIELGGGGKMAGEPRYYDNSCRSNSSLLVVGGYAGWVRSVQADRWTLEKIAPSVGRVAQTLTPTKAGAWITDTHFRDTEFVGGASFDDAGARMGGYGVPAPDNDHFSWFVDWTLTVSGAPGAAVSIVDATGATVFSGTLDDAGKAEMPLSQARYYGPKYASTVSKDVLTPHLVTVGGVTQSVTMDAKQAINFP